MNETNPEGTLEAKANLFKALGHPIRLLILNLVERKPRHGEELAAILNLTPATISHHAAKLMTAGLIEAQKDQYYQTYTLVEDLLRVPLGELIRLSQPSLKVETTENAYEEKVIKTFFRHGRLIRIPTQLKKQQVVLAVISKEFEPERAYSEREVNQILLDFHDDVATLRRGLITQKLMTQEKGIYRLSQSKES
jgi:DNA-binding transcriptional ArsR family regulator